MKRVIILIGLIIQLAGCEKIFFEETAGTICSIDSQSELESALTGIYYSLAQAYNSVAIYINQRVLGDDIHCKSTGSNPYYYDECYPHEGVSRFHWSTLYNTIISSNNIIIQFENTDNILGEFKDYIGEAYLIRGYCYYNLARFYGRVPVIDDIDIKYDLTLSSFKEVYDFIEKDFIKAIEYLPDNNDHARAPFVTPNRGTAKAMLAEVYLTMAGYPLKDDLKYIQAAKYAKEVIDSALFFGFELLQDFANVWKGEKTNHKESVFSLHFSDSEEYELNNVVYRYMPEYDWDGPRIYPEIKFYNNFPVNYRKDITFQTTVCLWEQGEKICRYYKTIDKTVPMYYKKFALVRDTTPSLHYAPYSNYAHSICLYRYAHTLLTYAEAKARSGQLDASAYEAVNMIRRRANFKDIHSPSVYDLQSGLTAEQFADSVVWERAWEFAGEPEGRWFDLLRLEMVDQLPELRYPEEIRPAENEVTEEYYFLPIPEEEIMIIPELNDNQ